MSAVMVDFHKPDPHLAPPKSDPAPNFVGSPSSRANGFVQIPTLAVFALDKLRISYIWPKCSSEYKDHKCVANFLLPDGTHLYCYKNVSIYIALF